MSFTRFSDAEMERRRIASVEALRAREREEFDRRYQEHCDTLYWSKGQCCAGCDFWNSDMGNSGECHHAGLVSGDQVLASMGAQFHTLHNPRPGYPLTKADQWCANFKDDFDWASLPSDYLERIGAKFGGVVQAKPSHKMEPDS